jgi:hypothetical protein
VLGKTGYFHPSLDTVGAPIQYIILNGFVKQGSVLDHITAEKILRATPNPE